jgi:hypothetical protein
MYNNLKNPLEKQLANKTSIFNASVISRFSVAIDPYKKNDMH